MLVMLIVLSIPSMTQAVTSQTDSLELDGAKFQLVPEGTVVMRPGDEVGIGKKCETTKKDFFHDIVTCTWKKTIKATEFGLMELGEMSSQNTALSITIFLLGIPMLFMALTMLYSHTEQYGFAKRYSIATTIITIIISFMAEHTLMFVAIVLSITTLYFVLSSRVTKIFYVTGISYIFLIFWFFGSLQ